MRKNIIFSAFVFVIIIALTACQNPKSADSENMEHPKKAVVFLVANTANSQGLNLDSDLVKDTIYETIRNGGRIAVISVDGTPELVLEEKYTYENASEAKIDLDAKISSNNLLTKMKAIIANHPETDYLASLQLAARFLSTLGDEDEYDKSIVVVGTGLSSQGELNFQNNLISADPEMIAEMLKSKQDIPDLDSVKVYFQQIADVAAPQKELTSIQIDKLKDIYSAIIKSGGGTAEFDQSLPVASEVEDDFPSVTPIEFPDETPTVFDPENIEGENDMFESPIVLPERRICFVGDKAEFSDKEEALIELESIADYLKKNHDETIVIAGTTAGDIDDQRSIELSYQRASLVMDALIELGVDENQCVSVGLGCHDEWHVSGLDPSGEESAINRKVVLIKGDSESGKKILEEQK